MTAAQVRQRDRGALSVMLMMLVVITLGGAALIVDGGRAMTARRHAANTAEASARSAVAAQSLTDGFDPDAAIDVARSYATRAGIDGADIDIIIRDGVTGLPEIVVTITERRQAVFVALGGAESLIVRATGAATFVYGE
jgi:Flp pilus assembly protein TadG